MRGFGRLLILVVVRKFSVVHRGHSVVLPERPIRQPHHSSSRVNIEHRQLVFGQQRARRLLQALALRQSCRFGKPAKPPPLPQAAIRRRHCNQGAAFQNRHRHDRQQRRRRQMVIPRRPREPEHCAYLRRRSQRLSSPLSIAAIASLPISEKHLRGDAACHFEIESRG
jgi:hypothetical protein